LKKLSAKRLRAQSFQIKGKPKNVTMKKVKIGLIALGLGIFAVSCGSNQTETETTATDSVMNGSMDAGGTGTDMGISPMDTTMGTGMDTTGALLQGETYR